MPENTKNPNPHKDHRTRMKKQFLRAGIDQFEPHQVLELLLFYGIPQKDTNPLAHELINTFGDLPSVLDASFEDLCRVKGISSHTATLLVLCGQLLPRYYREKADKQTFSSVKDMAEFLQAEFVNEKKEKVVLLSLNNRRQFINCSVVHRGSLTSTEACARELVQTALQYGATAVVIAHNHPAGYSVPSSDDLATTKELVRAFKMMDIAVVDHLVFSPEGYFSMHDSPYYAPAFSALVTRLDQKQGDEF